MNENVLKHVCTIFYKILHIYPIVMGKYCLVMTLTLDPGKTFCLDVIIDCFLDSSNESVGRDGRMVLHLAQSSPLDWMGVPE